MFVNIRRKKLICKGCYFQDGSSQVRRNAEVKLQHFLLLQLPQHHLQSLTVLSQVRALIIILQQTPMLLNCLSMEFDRFKGASWLGLNINLKLAPLAVYLLTPLAI